MVRVRHNGVVFTADSCFSYDFHDALVVEFCALANCCPDTNRFAIAHSVQNDSIVVTIADTARHLCRCICTYVLHVEFSDLQEDSYQFVCRREDYSSQIVPYSQRVFRR